MRINVTRKCYREIKTSKIEQRQQHAKWGGGGGDDWLKKWNKTKPNYAQDSALHSNKEKSRDSQVINDYIRCVPVPALQVVKAEANDDARTINRNGSWIQKECALPLQLG